MLIKLTLTGSIHLRRKNLFLPLIALATTFVVSTYNGCGNNGKLAGALDSTFGSHGIAATPFSSTQINLSWPASTESDLAGYKIARNGVIIAAIPGATTTYASTGLSPATTYTFQVTSYDIAGNVAVQSAVVTATTFP